MLNVEHTNQFKRDLKLVKRRGKNLDLLFQVMSKVENEEVLKKKLRDHQLKNNWSSHRKLHIEPDWFLVYRLVQNTKTVIFVRTGTHSDLFN